MQNLEYSAGAVSKGFWFQEFKKYTEMIKMGKTEGEIRELQERENILMASSPSYGKRIISEISKRRKVLSKEIVKLFFDLDISNQKLINLLGIMMNDRLFFEYIYEVYRENIILGTKDFEDSSIRIFFKNKSEQSKKVAEFTEQTKKRLGTAYKNYLKEANLLEEENGILIYHKPIMDLQLEAEMKKPSFYSYFKALTGVA
ncbi:DUF1819 family protein [Clostridium sp. HV4-5-A1G]|uniref:DUF1819 family protein n=1 Tax=Clostridium sp. HV4-5-A1G TaxID=2004595 RepID=UPI00123870F9|nr:DUF1819 family protein [Clostridium sp. HV4-5-A1G]KAA8675101.1 DUF1819 family protein [Clostridium sp. HV4-5-A1G]